MFEAPEDSVLSHVLIGLAILLTVLMGVAGIAMVVDASTPEIPVLEESAAYISENIEYMGQERLEHVRDAW